MATIYEYEVEVTARHRISGETTTQVFRLFAYTPMDALTQASVQAGTNDLEIKKLLSIGPPRDLIAAAETTSRLDLERLMHAIAKAAPR
jgi:hypothetical protein